MRASLGVGRGGVACLRSAGKMDVWKVDFVVLVIAVVSRSGYVLGHTCYATVSSPCQCQFVSEGKNINISYFDDHPYVRAELLAICLPVHCPRSSLKSSQVTSSIHTKSACITYLVIKKGG